MCVGDSKDCSCTDCNAKKCYSQKGISECKEFVRLPDNRLIFTVIVCDAVHADAHELVQCRILFHPNPPSVVSYLNSESEDWQAVKEKSRNIPCSVRHCLIKCS